MHIMIDIETLGTTPGSVILSIGAVPFDAKGVYTEKGYYTAIKPSTCIEAGLTMDPDTIKWWMGQSDAARAAAFSDETTTLYRALVDLMAWFKDVGGHRIWCHGATFDVPLLDAAYRAAGLASPWKFYDARCTRTLYELAGVEVDRSKGTHHNALDDAINQAEAAVRAFEILDYVEDL